MSQMETSLGQYLLPVKSLNPAVIYGNDDFQYLDIASVNRELKCITTPQTLSTADAPSRARQLVRKSDIIISTVRPNLNTVAMVEDEYDNAIASTGFCVLRANPDRLDCRYLYHWISSQKIVDYLVSVATGASYPAVSDKIIKGISFNPPRLIEQKRIAAILDKADSLRRKRQQAIQLTDDFLRAVFLEMFGDPVTNPKNFQTISVRELIVKGPSNGLYKPSSEYVDSDSKKGTPILRIDGFYNGKIAANYKFKRVKIDDETRDKFALSENSIVINRVNSKEYVGKAMLVDGLDETTVFESNMMNFAVDESRVMPLFLVTQLTYEYVRGQIANMRKDAVNQSSINQQDVKAIEIRLPNLVQQKEYCKIARKIDNLLLKFQAESDFLKVFSASLQNQYF